MKEIFQNMKKSHLRIQFIALSVLQEAAEATIVTNFADEHAQALMMLFIDFINDEFVRYSREKNDDSDKEFWFDKELKEDTRLLSLSIYEIYK